MIDRYNSQIVEDSQNEIFSFHGESLILLHANRGARENLGYSKAAISKLTPVDIKPLFTEASFRERIEFLRQGDNRKIEFETIHKRQDGTLYPVEVHLQFGKYDEVPIFTEIIIDITKRIEREKVLKNAIAEIANQKYALDQSAIVSITDLDGIITYVNDKFCDISGYTREELIGEDHRIVNSRYHKKEFLDGMYQSVTGGGSLERRG